MPYRINATQSRLCLVCSASSTTICRNCNGSHCEIHMLGASCAGCQGQLWAMERRQVVTVANGTIGAGLAGVAVAAFVGTATTLAWPLVVGYVALTPFAILASRSLIRRKLARHKLMPTSIPFCLPAPGEGTAAVDSNRESAYDIRRRRNKSKKGRGSGGGVRAVFMTRGGHFYQ